MNWSLEEVAEVPPGVVTVTSVTPAAPGGATTVIWLSETTVKLVAATVPNWTAVAPVKPEPVMVTAVPPAVEPDGGLTPLTTGAGTQVNWSLEEVAEVPPGVVTVTSVTPAAPGGATAVIWLSETTVKLVAATVPNWTAVAPVKPEPVMVTAVPPAVEPDGGLTPLTTGAGTQVNWSLEEVAEVPPGVVTVTSVTPAAPGGATTVIWLSETTVKLVAATVPNWTAVAPVKPEPVMVTAVPPAVEPDGGLTPLTTGAGTQVNWSLEEVAEVPPGVVTVTSVTPAAPGGATTVIWLSETTVKLVAATVPNWTAVAPVKPEPVMVTAVPPAVEPDGGLTPLTTGAGTQVNWSLEEVAEVPPGVVTVTSVTPAAPGGATAVIWLSETTVKLVAATVPNWTAVAPVKPEPVMVTAVPPAVEPDGGLTPLTTGIATTVSKKLCWAGVPTPLPAGDDEEKLPN